MVADVIIVIITCFGICLLSNLLSERRQYDATKGVPPPPSGSVSPAWEAIDGCTHEGLVLKSKEFYGTPEEQKEITGVECYCRGCGQWLHFDRICGDLDVVVSGLAKEFQCSRQFVLQTLAVAAGCYWTEYSSPLPLEKDREYILGDLWNQATYVYTNDAINARGRLKEQDGHDGSQVPSGR